MSGLPAMRMALAGLGAASTEIVRALKMNPNVSLVAGCDVRLDLLEVFAAEEGVPIYTSVAEMAASPEVDVVYVATPNHLHHEHVVAAAKAGKDVIVEKPIALSLDECNEMIAVTERHGTRLLAGHTHSFDAPVVAMAELVAKGAIGEPYMINQWYFTDWLYRGRGPDELDTDLGGGVVYRQAPHGLDIIRLLADRPATRVKARTSSFDNRGSTHGSYSAFIDFEGGLHATVVFSGYAFFDSSELTFGIGEAGCPRPVGTNAQARDLIRSFSAPGAEAEYKRSVSYGGEAASDWQALVLRCPEEERFHPFYGLTVVSGSRGDLRQSPEGLYLYDEDGRHEIAVPKQALEREAEINVLYEAWRDRRPLDSHDGKWARDTLRLCLAVIDSAESGLEVRL
jgi:phthalate 4,5-cis-dihydrodiol dehydrogenase